MAELFRGIDAAVEQTMNDVAQGMGTAAELTADAAVKGSEMTAAAIGKAWSLMEAATEKTSPSGIMSQEAIRRMQGKAGGG